MNDAAGQLNATLLARLAKRLFSILLAVLRLVFPVIALIGAYGLSYFSQQPITLFDRFFPAGPLMPGYWLTWGHILVMLAFFVVMLTNRAFGPPYALAQVVIAWLVITGAWFSVAGMVSALPGSPLPPRRVLAAMLFALACAHLANIVVFEAARGKPWWRAPFLSGLAAALILPSLYWPLAKWGAEPFLGRLTVDFAIKAATVYVLLGAYALLRPAIRPRAGLGGY